MGFYNIYRLLKEIRYFFKNLAFKKLLTILIIFVLILIILHTKGYCATYTELTGTPFAFNYSASTGRIFETLPPNSNPANYPLTTFRVYSLKSGSTYIIYNSSSTSTICLTTPMLPNSYDFNMYNQGFDSAISEGCICGTFSAIGNYRETLNCGYDMYFLVPLSGNDLTQYISVFLVDKEATGTDITNSTDTITGSIADSTDDINNTITDSTDAINDTLTDNTVSVNSNQLVTDNTQDITKDGYNNIFEMIRTAFTGSPSAITFPIPFVNQSFTLQPDFLSHYLQVGGLGFFVTLMSAYWYFIVSRYIVKRIYVIIENLKSGELEQTTGNIKTEVF